MIGIFDSGMGGLTVLSEGAKILSNEDFVYFGDSKNIPYGTKTKSEVIKLSKKICQMLIDKYKVKAIIIACNTATSAAVNVLRDLYDIPIIGMEPAIKPALDENRGNKVAVLATEMTLREEKFNKLVESFENSDKIIKIPCSELVNLIEKVDFKREEIDLIIDKCLEKFSKIESIVLGCTHFLFIKKYLKEKFIKENIRIYDGNSGTILNLKRILNEDKLLNNKNVKGKILILNSGSQEVLNKSIKLFNKYHKED